MAFTIHQQPQQYTPAYNDQMFVVSSTNSAEPSFKYVAKINIGGDLVTIKKSPHPIYGSAYLNTGKIVENSLTHDVKSATPLTGFNLDSNSIAKYSVTFFEEYEIAGVLTESALMATSNTIYVYNGVIDFLPFKSYANADYLLDSGNILSHTEKRNVKLTDNDWLYYMCDNVTAGHYAIINTYDSAGLLIANRAITNPYQTTTTYSHHHLRFASGPANLNMIANANITGAVQPIITSSVARYEIFFSDTVDESGTYNSPAYRFELEDGCERYERFRIAYQNALGAMEYQSFDRASKHTEEIKKEKYKSIVGGLTSPSAYGYNLSDAGDKILSTTIKDKYLLRSNWLSEDQYALLAQLVSSPVVYWDHPTYGLISVTVDNTNYEYLKTVNKRMKNLEITISPSYNRYRQRG